MSIPPGLRSDEFDYALPQERIARFPAETREGARLLVARGAGPIEHALIPDLPRLLREANPGLPWVIVLNETRVIPARLVFQKKSGGRLEVFLLRPLLPSRDPGLALASGGPALWEAFVGGKTKEGESIRHASGLLARVAERAPGHPARVELSWEGDEALSELLARAGETPLPPYLARKAELADRERYQTVFARREGSVAAPTASLHLTEGLLSALERLGHRIVRLSLHVGAGTFRPLASEFVRDHPMHAERLEIERGTLEALRDALREREAGRCRILCCGTTALRALESAVSGTGKEDAYRGDAAEPPSRALERLLQGLSAPSSWVAETELFLGPGARFSADALLTNFHQPRSSLLCLVAGFLAPQADWRALYAEALRAGYRFLSYGDASLLIRDHSASSARSDPMPPKRSAL